MIQNTNSPQKATRERSPAFPLISLKQAVNRLEQFYKTFRYHPTPATKVGIAWEMKENGSQSARFLAALKYFGMLDYEGSGNDRNIVITEDAKNYLKAQQESIKKEILQRFALTPKEILKFWQQWGAERPHDAVCKDELTMKHNYNSNAAPIFLNVYDETIAFAELNSQAVPASFAAPKIDTQDLIEKLPESNAFEENTSFSSAEKKYNILQENEQVLQEGILSRNATYKIIVTGKIGAKEIQRIIDKLELDKKIFLDMDNGED